MSAIVTALVVLVVTYLLLVHFGMIKISKFGFPGPKQYPLVGSLYSVFEALRTHNLGQSLKDLAAKYGKYCEITIGPMPVIIISDPEAHHSFLVADDFQRDGLLQNAMFNENALFAFPRGDVWHKHRKALQPAFGPTHLRQVIAHTISRCEILIKHMSADKKELTLTNLFRSISLDVLGLTTYSYDFRYIEKFLTGELTEETDPMTYLARLLQKRVFAPKWLYKYMGWDADAPMTKKYLGVLEDTLRQMLKEKPVREPDNYDMVDRLRSEKNGFTEEEMMGEITGFYFAGHDTTSSTLSFMFKNMALYPDKFQKLCQEIRSKKDEPITIESLADYQYLDFFFKETQRLNPVASMISRVNVKPMVLGGRQIPANVNVFYSLFAMQTSEEYWPEPLAFKPERWEGLVPVRGTFLPFGAGPTMCIGQKMATIEIKTAVICLLRELDFELVPDQDLTILYDVTAHMKHGLKMYVSKA